MSRSRVAVGLGIAISLQVLVLVGMVVQAALPLWSGIEIRVKTMPVDPRSMFRGNYARLRYAFSRVPDRFAPDGVRPRVGEIVYVSLKPGRNGLYDFVGVSLDKPKHGVFLRGRISNDRTPFRVRYGIEAFFAPKERALQLEQALRRDGVAVLMVSDSGRVALKDVVPTAARD